MPLPENTMEADPATSSRCRRKTFTLEQSPPSAPGSGTVRQTQTSSVDVCNRTFISQPDVPFQPESVQDFGRTILVDSVAVPRSRENARPNTNSTLTPPNMNDAHRAFEDSGDLSFWINERAQQSPRSRITKKEEDYLKKCLNPPERLLFRSALDSLASNRNTLSCGATPGKNKLNVSEKCEEDLFEASTVQSEVSHVAPTSRKSTSGRDMIRIEKRVIQDELDKAMSRLHFIPASKNTEMQRCQQEARNAELQVEANKKREVGYKQDVKKASEKIDRYTQLRKDIFARTGVLAQIPSSVLKLNDQLFICRDKTFCENFCKESVKPCDINANESPTST